MIDCQNRWGVNTLDHVLGVGLTRTSEMSMSSSWPSVFFSSTSVRSGWMDVKPWDAVVEESEDFFYNVVVPSPLMGCEHFWIMFRVLG